ncbi:putative transcription factor interactor and regulator CCHC(Zn) family [Medicago truncatula]|uniref:Putative transcription factor interactor and regulator CCHC(Zn) family n=1 Tax=Medicago truncatula TaxID=3880 RepID=A0A396IJD8_MEDTR|nr:putative transcription factor interactor and regulator CCHC(Zn) family [Medicago truncatula]
MKKASYGIKCSRCKQSGHNKSTCPLPPHSPPESETQASQVPPSHPQAQVETQTSQPQVSQTQATKPQDTQAQAS